MKPSVGLNIFIYMTGTLIIRLVYASLVDSNGVKNQLVAKWNCFTRTHITLNPWRKLRCCRCLTYLKGKVSSLRTFFENLSVFLVTHKNICLSTNSAIWYLKWEIYWKLQLSLSCVENPSLLCGLDCFDFDTQETTPSYSVCPIEINTRKTKHQKFLNLIWRTYSVLGIKIFHILSVTKCMLSLSMKAVES